MDVPPEDQLNYKHVSSGHRNQWDHYPKGNQHVYDEKWRASAKERVIDRFVKIKENIQTKIDDFYYENMSAKTTIGIHLRGPHKHGEIPYVPIPIILAEANKYAGPDVQFFVATDQIALLELAKKELNGPVIYYECERFWESTAPDPGMKLHPKLGEDVLIEAMLLSRCDFFVHTILHLSTTVLYFNPSLKHEVLF